MDYYQTDHKLPIVNRSGTPAKGVLMGTKRKKGKGWNPNKGGIRIPKTDHMEILQDPRFLNDVARRASGAYIWGINVDQYKAKRPDTWDTKKEGGKQWKW